MQDNDLPVVVIGAGPVGLAAAANLHQRHIGFVVYEQGHDVAATVREWGHVQLFSPWAMNIDPAGGRLLAAAGWDAPDLRSHPTGSELVNRYLAPLAQTAPLAAALQTDREVIGVTRHGVDKTRVAGRGQAPFVVTTASPAGVERIVARAVIDASGTWRTPNPIGTDGRPAPGEGEAAARITYGIPAVLGADRDRYAGQRVAVLGSGHSARHVVRDLARLVEEAPGTEVVWVTRRADAAALLDGPASDLLPERARLVADAHRLIAHGTARLETGFGVTEVTETACGVELRALDGRRIGPFCEIVATTGFRPDLSALSELQLDLDPALESSRKLAPMIDPNVHDCASVPIHGAAELAHPEPDLYVVGAKSYGRAPTFLLSTGYEQVRSVVAELAGDHVAAATPVHEAAASACAPDALVSACGPAVSVPVGGCVAGEAAVSACGPAVAVSVPLGGYAPVGAAAALSGADDVACCG